MVQKGDEVAEDAREVRATAAYIEGAKTQIEIMYKNFNADYAQFNAKYANFNILYEDVKKNAYQVHLDALETHKDYLATLDLYNDLKSGQVYRGTWDPQTNAYPDGGGTNSTWDVILPRDVESHTFDNKEWRSGDRLIFVLETDAHIQIETGSGVLSINGHTGVVTLDASDVEAVPIDGGTMTDALFFDDSNKYVSFESDDIYLAAKDGVVYIEGKTDPIARVGSRDYKFYHEGKKPSAADINAVGLSGNSTIGGILTASQFRAVSSKAFVSNLRDTQGIFMDVTEPNRRTILGGGGTSTEQVGQIHLRPNGFSSNRGETIFTAFGQINNSVDPVDPAHLTNKKYVDMKTLSEEGEGLLMRVGGPRDEAIDVALAGATGGAFVSETAPANPFQGARWFDTNDGRTYIYFDDGDSKQWVEENPQSANETLANPIIVQLAQEGTLDVADGKKGAITVNGGSSISMQDQPTHTVFHHFAEGNGIEWAHGDLAENTLMTLDAGGNLHTKGPIYSAEGHVVESPDLKTWVSMEANSGVDPYIATKSTGETSVRKTIEFLPSKVRFGKPIFTNQAHITDDAGLIFAPSDSRAGTTWGVGINSSTRTLAAHRYVDGVWAQSPLEFSSAGVSTFNSNVFVNGNIATNQGFIQINRDANPMVELHSPGKTAGIIYLPGPGRMRFSQSNGAGGEVGMYAEIQLQSASFNGCVRPRVPNGSWGQWGDAVGGIQDLNGTASAAAGQWFPMVTSASYTSPGVGYAGRWSIGYYRPATQHNGEFVINMNGDGALRNNLRFVMSGAANGGIRMDGTDTGAHWAIQEGGQLYGSIFAGYKHMVAWCQASFAPASDEKLKKNIQPSTKSALDNVSKIKFHSFDWIDGKTKSSDLGLIAQELEEINPSYSKDIETFKPDGSVDTSFKALDTANLLALALKSIQELKAEIEELKEKVNG
ncbi:MAG: tail fiber domain-containing protein [Fusobacteriaceae bacterium]